MLRGARDQPSNVARGGAEKLLELAGRQLPRKTTKRLDDGPEWEALGSEWQAATLEDPCPGPLSAFCDFMGEPALANSGLAGHQNDSGPLSVAGALEHRSDTREFRCPADESGA